LKVCLVRCPSPFLIDEKVFPPLGLMAVGTGLKSQGHDVYIRDDLSYEIPKGFDYYGFGPTTPEYPYAVEAKNAIKKHNPSARVVIGGPFASLNVDVCKSDGFCCVVVGDGEFATEQAFKTNMGVIYAKNKPLENYPTIDRNLIDIKSYEYFINDRLTTTVVTSRGCPYRCAFCSHNYSSVRFQEISKSLSEISTLHHDFGYNALMFFDDIFIMIPERVKKICNHLKRLGIIWRCFVRGDLVVKHGVELLQTMADSGCVEVGMGIESGSETILKNINKGESVNNISTAIKMLKSVGIRVKGFMIVGLPGENFQTIKETNDFLSTAQLDDVDFTIFRPYPGSPIWKNKDQYDVEWDDINLSEMFYKGKPGDYRSIVSTSELSANDIVKARDELHTQWV